MKMSVFYDHVRKAAEQQGISLQEMLVRARMMGYGMVEMDFDALQPNVEDALKAVGMEISSIYCFFDFGNSSQQDRRRALVEAAVRTGAKKIMPIPGFYSSADEEVRTAERDRMLLAMWALMAEGQAAGLTVTIEDYDDEPSPIRNSEGMAWFLEKLPELRVTYDTGNFRYSCEDEMHAFDALSEKIVHVHLKDRSLEAHENEQPKTAMDGAVMYSSPVGGGIVPMECIFQRLKAIGYDGVLTVEHFDSADMQANMQASADYLKKYFSFV